MPTDPIAVLQAKIDAINRDTKVMKDILRLCAKVKEEDSQQEDKQKLDGLLGQLAGEG